MNVQQIKIEITVQGPFLTHGLGAKQFGLDTSIARNQKGDPVIPGSLIKGNLLHAIDELNILSEGEFFPQELLLKLFGQVAKNDNEPERGALNFDYYWNLKSPLIERDNKTVNRIKINQESSTVEKGSLQVIESPFLQGNPYTFVGSISFYSLDEKTLKHLQNTCEKAFQFISHIGALKGIGFGKILHTQVSSSVKSLKKTKDHKLKKLSRFLVNINFDRPVCFSKQSSKENLFVSEEHLTGAIVKGAIANKIHNSSKCPNLKSELANVMIGWLKPSKGKSKPRIIPLSVAFSESHDDSSEFINDMNGDITIGPLNSPMFAKAWQSDWKGEVFDLFTQQNKDFQTVGLVKNLFVRTAINGFQEDNVQLKNTAKDRQLFSFQCIEEKDDASSVINWKGIIDISETENPQAISKELQLIFGSPLIGLGKTKAQATVTLTKAPALESITTNDKSVISIVLESDVLIDLKIPKYTPCLNVFQAYKEAFNEIDSSLVLVDMCAEQHLQGGRYYWHRYFKNSLKQYQPQVLTSAGSVFVFENSVQAKERIERWLRLGIDPSKEQLGNYINEAGNVQENWQVNPFNRGNGYGEISLLPNNYMNLKEKVNA